MDEAIESCRKLNRTAAIVFVVLFIGFYSLLKSQLPKEKETVNLYRYQVVASNLSDTATDENDLNYPLKAVESGKVNVKNLVLAFFGVTALAHLLYATDFFGKGWYSNALTKGWNPFRWIEYGISASLMVAIIAPFSGQRDASSVGLIVAANAAMQGQGFLVERALIAQGGPDLTSAYFATLVGWLLLVAAWASILRAFFNTLNDVNKLGTFKLPSWLWGIGVVQAAFFSSFGFVQLAQLRDAAKSSGDVASNFLRFEKSYLVLSFLAKASLASVLAYGLVGRNQESNA
jgi:hypothetical protein